ncbi:MAG UNVERIFIED_CONTAM: hypothetical protein LVQ98_06760 [Rickettsiaceae bacterium]|jgi:hypothetical protein
MLSGTLDELYQIKNIFGTDLVALMSLADNTEALQAIINHALKVGGPGKVVSLTTP